MAMMSAFPCIDVIFRAGIIDSTMRYDIFKKWNFLLKKSHGKYEAHEVQIFFPKKITNNVQNLYQMIQPWIRQYFDIFLD